MAIDIIKIIKVVVAVCFIGAAIAIGTFAAAWYFKAKAIAEAKDSVVKVVDSERVQNWLKDHCSKPGNESHVRCAAMK